MKLEDFLNFIEKFIYDFVGIVLPGFLFILIIFSTLNIDLSFTAILDTLGRLNAAPLILMIGFGYIMGHVAIEIGMFADSRFSLLWQLFADKPFTSLWKLLGDRRLSFIRKLLTIKIAKSFDENAWMSKPEFKAFCAEAGKYCAELKSEGIPDSSTMHSFRNIALALGHESPQLTYKFMFISQMCLGSTTVSIAGAFSYIHFIYTSFKPNDPSTPHWYTIALIVVFLLIVLPLFLFRRARDFKIRALSCPFAEGLIELKKITKHET